MTLRAQAVLQILAWIPSSGSTGSHGPSGAAAWGLALSLAAAALTWVSAGRWRGIVNRMLVPVLAADLGMRARLRGGDAGVISLFGLDTWSVADDLLDLSSPAGLGLLPVHRRMWAEWTVSGEHGGRPFVAAGVVRWRRTLIPNDFHAFHGFHLVVSIGVPAPFRGRVVATRKGGPAPDGLRTPVDTLLSGQGLPPRLEAPEVLAGRFSVLADDPDEAARLITPAVAEGLLAIDRDGPGHPLRAGFQDGRMWLVLDMPRPLLQQPRLFRPVSETMAGIWGITEELTLPHRLIDRLYGDRAGQDGRPIGADGGGLAGH